MLSDSFVVIDFETTGFSPTLGDRITEVAAVRIDGNRISDRYQSLVNCGVTISPFITHYTGITQRMVDRAPPAKKVIRELIRFLDNTPVVAHNASFDQRFFRSECQQSGLSEGDRQFICSMRLARRVYPRLTSHGLEFLAKQLRISYRGNAHRAGVDAEVTANVMIRLGRDLTARHTRLLVDAPLLHRLMKMPVRTAHIKLERLGD
jgi:DNA polymerase III subunit epsilon